MENRIQPYNTSPPHFELKGHNKTRVNTHCELFEYVYYV